LKKAGFGVQVAALLIEKRIGDRVWGVGDNKKIEKGKAKINGGP
jgi:hypothetical protein